MIKRIKNALLGIGNDLRGDDGAGSFIAQNFYHKNWFNIDGKSAPENCTSIIKRIKPSLLVIIDAAYLSLDTGNFRLISPDKITSLQLSTHSMPLHLLIEYISPYCQKILLIGIQPLNTKLGDDLSKPVLKSCNEIINILKNNKIESIPEI